jgi:predicted ATP-grasp superfamily ATP-dependent carboligase
MLTGNRALWGNPPGVLRRARDPFAVARLFRAHGISSPNISNDPHVSNDSNDWLVKPLSSGGGHGIRQWRRGSTMPAGRYLQQRIDGTPGSVVFIAAAGRAVPVGVSRQLIGDRRFGSEGYRYCGSILAPSDDPQFANGAILFSAAHDLAAIASSGLGLAGLNGIDFVARAGVPYPIEINPRWSASMELVERALGISLFAAHAAACTRGELPDVPVPHGSTVGKAIVFAREPCVAGNTDGWLADADIRDVPHPGDPIAAGSPVCTVFAGTDSAATCEAALVARAKRVFADMRRWTSTIHDSQFAIDDLND